MKKLFCSQYDDVDCCITCHHDDSFFVSNYKNYRIGHCCTSLKDIQKDINKHEEKLEDSCND